MICYYVIVNPFYLLPTYGDAGSDLSVLVARLSDGLYQPRPQISVLFLRVDLQPVQRRLRIVKVIA